MEETTQVYKVVVRSIMGNLYSYWTAGEFQLQYSTVYWTLPAPGTDGLFAFATLEDAIACIKRPTTAGNEIWLAEATNVRPPGFSYVTHRLYPQAILSFWENPYALNSLMGSAMKLSAGTVLCDSIRLVHPAI